MIYLLLLVILFALITFIFLALTVFSLVKKKKKMAVISLLLFVLFTLITVFTGYTYAKKSIDYMASEEFQNETKTKGENLGKSYGNTVSGVAKGLEATLDDEAIAKLANKSAVITGKVIKASSAGFDSVGKTKILSDKSIESSGIEIGRATIGLEGSENNIGLFLDFNKDFKGKLKLTSYDLQGAKMDVVTVEVSEKAGGGKVIIFNFKYAAPGISGYCILSKI